MGKILINLLISSIIICILKITLITCELSYFKNVFIYSLIRTGLFLILNLKHFIDSFFYFILFFIFYFIIGFLLIGILKILSEYCEGISFIIAGIIAESVIALLAYFLFSYFLNFS